MNSFILLRFSYYKEEDGACYDGTEEELGTVDVVLATGEFSFDFKDYIYK